MRRWLLCVMICGACGKSERKPKPAPAPDAAAAVPAKPDVPWFDELASAPIEVSEVTAKQVKGQSDQYLSIHFTLASRSVITERQVLTVRAACKVGELVLVATAAPLVDLQSLAVADTRPLDAIPFGLNGFVGTADACELGFFLDCQEPGTSPGRFQTFCWSGGAVADGPCTALAPKAGGAPFQLTSAELSLDGDRLRVATTITVGKTPAGDEQPALNTRCEIAGQVVSAEAPTLASFASLSPGESLRITGTVPAASPTWCELSVVIKPMVSGPAIDLGKRCLRDGKVRDGGC